MLKQLNKRTGKLDVFDISLTKLSVFFFTLFLVGLVPVLLRLDWKIALGLGVLLAIRPTVRFFR